MLLTRFAATRPRYEISQQRCLAWLAAAHTEAEVTSARLDEPERQKFAARITRTLHRCACGPDRLARRGHSLADLESSGFAGNTLYDLHRHPHGAGSAARTRRYGEIVDAYFGEAYAADVKPPDDLIHVTCTGYVSPSGAQKLVATRGWGATTRVTHAYQMGCYAAVPALRIAAGFAASGARRVDIVHTELCSLHLDPSDHRVEQLVIQSLFADGFIRYSLTTDEHEPGLRVLAAYEQVLPDSADAMVWQVGDWGMQMSLARDVPERIAAALREAVIELYRRAGRDLDVRRSMFAVHPGGPKIIDAVGRVLELDDAQLAASREVLRDHGNMSSATLPHIWMRMLHDRAIAPGTVIAGLAFGPGLTICGALLEKR